VEVEVNWPDPESCPCSANSGLKTLETSLQVWNGTLNDAALQPLPRRLTTPIASIAIADRLGRSESALG